MCENRAGSRTEGSEAWSIFWSRFGVICFHPTLKIILTGSESLAVLLAVR